MAATEGRVFRVGVLLALGAFLYLGNLIERDLAAIAAHTVNPIGVKVSLDEMTVDTLNRASNPCPAAPAHKGK